MSDRIHQKSSFRKSGYKAISSSWRALLRKLFQIKNSNRPVEDYFETNLTISDPYNHYLTTVLRSFSLFHNDPLETVIFE